MILSLSAMGKLALGYRNQTKPRTLPMFAFVCVLEFILVHVSRLDCIDKLMPCVYFPLWQQVPPAG